MFKLSDKDLEAAMKKMLQQATADTLKQIKINE